MILDVPPEIMSAPPSIVRQWKKLADDMKKANKLRGRAFAKKQEELQNRRQGILDLIKE